MDEKEIKNIYELSKKTKVPYSTICYMIDGHDMQVSTIIELARFFNVPIDYLVSRSYGIECCKENGSIFLDTTNFIEAAVSTWM